MAVGRKSNVLTRKVSFSLSTTLIGSGRWQLSHSSQLATSKKHLHEIRICPDEFPQYPSALQQNSASKCRCVEVWNGMAVPKYLCPRLSKHFTRSEEASRGVSLVICKSAIVWVVREYSVYVLIFPLASSVSILAGGLRKSWAGSKIDAAPSSCAELLHCSTHVARTNRLRGNGSSSNRFLETCLDSDSVWPTVAKATVRGAGGHPMYILRPGRPKWEKIRAYLRSQFYFPSASIFWAWQV
jgi:hypothetical protein